MKYDWVPNWENILFKDFTRMEPDDKVIYTGRGPWARKAVNQVQDGDVHFNSCVRRKAPYKGAGYFTTVYLVELVSEVKDNEGNPMTKVVTSMDPTYFPHYFSCAGIGSYGDCIGSRNPCHHYYERLDFGDFMRFGADVQASVRELLISKDDDLMKTIENKEAGEFWELQYKLPPYGFKVVKIFIDFPDNSLRLESNMGTHIKTKNSFSLETRLVDDTYNLNQILSVLTPQINYLFHVLPSFKSGIEYPERISS